MQSDASPRASKRRPEIPEIKFNVLLLRRLYLIFEINLGKSNEGPAEPEDVGRNTP